MKSINNLILEQFGVTCEYRLNYLKKVKGATLNQVALPDHRRIYLTVINNSSSDLYVSPEYPVDSTTGLLVASGSIWTIDWRSDLILPSLGWYIPSGTDCTSINVLEVLLR